jgi:hypothetical protein
MKGTNRRGRAHVRLAACILGGILIPLGCPPAAPAATVAPSRATPAPVGQGTAAYLANASRNVVALLRGTPSKRQAKLNRMFQGEEFTRFQAKNRAKARHYAGLASEPNLSTQILYQLHRSEKVRKARAQRRKRLPVQVAQAPGSRAFLPHNRSLRRYAYRTPFFAALRTNRMQALDDIREALSRGRASKPERVEMLRLAHALVRDRTDPAATLFAKNLFLTYALGDFDPRAQDYTPHLAFAYYARLETVPSVRQANGTRFTQRSHAAIPPPMARRMYSSRAYDTLRESTRVQTTSTSIVGR